MSADRIISSCHCGSVNFHSIETEILTNKTLTGLGQSDDYFKIMDKASLEKSRNLSFRQALEIVAHDLWLKIGLSPWMYILHPRFRRLKNAFNELEVIYMSLSELLVN